MMSAWLRVRQAQPPTRMSLQNPGAEVSSEDGNKCKLSWQGMSRASAS